MKKTQNSIVAALLRPGLNPKHFPPELLFYWLARPRNPVFASSDPLTKMFIKAMLSGKPTNFIYTGGSTPGAPRTVQVSLVFQHEPAGRIDVAGYTHQKNLALVVQIDKNLYRRNWFI